MHICTVFLVEFIGYKMELLGFKKSNKYIAICIILILQQIYNTWKAVIDFKFYCVLSFIYSWYFESKIQDIQDDYSWMQRWFWNRLLIFIWLSIETAYLKIKNFLASL